MIFKEERVLKSKKTFLMIYDNAKLLKNLKVVPMVEDFLLKRKLNKSLPGIFVYCMIF